MLSKAPRPRDEQFDDAFRPLGVLSRLLPNMTSSERRSIDAGPGSGRLALRARPRPKSASAFSVGLGVAIALLPVCFLFYLSSAHSVGISPLAAGNSAAGSSQPVSLSIDPNRAGDYIDGSGRWRHDLPLLPPSSVSDRLDAKTPADNQPLSPVELRAIETEAQRVVAEEEKVAVGASRLQAVPIFAPVGPGSQRQIALRQRSASGALGSAVPESIRHWEPLILESAAQYNLDPNLIAALMMTESNGVAEAVSSKGAMGLMQVMGGAADPAKNVDEGAGILAGHIARYDGQLDLALAAYNAGAGAVAQYGGLPPYRETRDHIFRVLLRYDLYSRP